MKKILHWFLYFSITKVLYCILEFYLFKNQILQNFLYSSCYYHDLLTFLKDAIVFWSSWPSLSAVWTLAEFATSSAFNSRHFCINRFSLSWLFTSALCNFSYSILNFSRLLSPKSSCNTSWNSCSSCWNVESSKAALVLSCLKNYYKLFSLFFFFFKYYLIFNLSHFPILKTYLIFLKI